MGALGACGARHGPDGGWGVAGSNGISIALALGGGVAVFAAIVALVPQQGELPQATVESVADPAAPAPEQAASGAAEEPPAEVAAAAPADAGSADTDGADTGEAEAQSAAAEALAVEAPRVDTFRVEPDGLTVIAGRAAPEVLVAVLLDGESVGEGETDPSGGFTLILDLPPADEPRVLSVVADPLGAAVMAEETYIVAPTPADVAEAETGSAETDVAAALSEVEQAPGASDVEDDVVQDGEAAVAPSGTDEAGGAAAETVEMASVAGEAAGAEEEPAAVAAVSGAEVVADVPDVAATQESVAAPEDVVPDGAGQGDQAANETAAAVAETGAETGAETVTATAEAAPEPAASEPAATEPADGTSAAVAAEAEVVPAPDLPAPDLVAEVPALDAPAPVETAAPPVLVSDADGVRVVQPALAPGAGPEVLTTAAVDAIAYDAEGRVSLSGRAAGGTTVRLYLDNAAVADVAVDGEGQWSADLTGTAPGVYTLRVDQIDAGGRVTSRVETPFLREERESIAAAMAEDTGEEGFAVAMKTVQPGNTLWAIARERYGEGVLYLQVFEANRDRIRDADLIYPGQVFVLPEIGPDDAAAEGTD